MLINALRNFYFKSTKYRVGQARETTTEVGSGLMSQFPGTGPALEMSSPL